MLILTPNNPPNTHLIDCPSKIHSHAKGSNQEDIANKVPLFCSCRRLEMETLQNSRIINSE